MEEKRFVDTSVEEIVIPHQRLYTIYLEVKRPDGSRVGLAWKVTPTGFSDTFPGSSWMRLLLNFNESLTTDKGVEVVSLQDTHPNEQEK
jgi:hypothetical protein